MNLLIHLTVSFEPYGAHWNCTYLARQISCSLICFLILAPSSIFIDSLPNLRMASGWGFNYSICIPAWNYATANINYTAIVCTKWRNPVIWYVKLCVAFFQNPHPGLFLIYYNSQSLLLIDKLCSGKMGMTDVLHKM